MDNNQLKELWEVTNSKLEDSLSITWQNTEDITKMKVITLLSSMKPVKVFAVMAGGLWVVLGAIVVTSLFFYNFDTVSPWFLFSAAIQILLTAIALVLYIYQTVHIYQADISAPVVIIQQKISTLISTSLLIARILFLQLPLWTTFYWNKNMIENGNTVFWMFQIVITLSFVFISGWLFFNIKYKNKDKKWFRFIFGTKEWEPVLKAIELNKEIVDFKREK